MPDWLFWPCLSISYQLSFVIYRLSLLITKTARYKLSRYTDSANWCGWYIP
jgi:hypothetical protein